MPEIIFSLAEERRDWLELRKETRKKNKKEWSDEYDGYICIADRGEIKSDATLNAALKRICADAGIPIVTTHNLRHIAATMMFEYVHVTRTIRKKSCCMFQNILDMPILELHLMSILLIWKRNPESAVNWNAILTQFSMQREERVF